MQRIGFNNYTKLQKNNSKSSDYKSGLLIKIQSLDTEYISFFTNLQKYYSYSTFINSTMY